MEEIEKLRKLLTDEPEDMTEYGHEDFLLASTISEDAGRDVIHTYVFKSRRSGKFYSVREAYDSWNLISDGLDLHTLKQVKRVGRKVIEYE